jgi:hypothetical protein
VRGQFRLGALMVGSAAMVNIRCIQRYLAAKYHSSRPELATGPCTDNSTTGVKLSSCSLLSSAWAAFPALAMAYPESPHGAGAPLFEVLSAASTVSNHYTTRR